MRFRTGRNEFNEAADMAQDLSLGGMEGTARHSQSACLLQGLLHLAEVCLLVEVGRHQLCQQRFEHEDQEEEVRGAQEADDGDVSGVHTRPVVCPAAEAGHENRQHQAHPEEPCQRFLHMATSR